MSSSYQPRSGTSSNSACAERPAGPNDEQNGLYGRLDVIPGGHHYRAGEQE
jgi:hypothetical protein